MKIKSMLICMVLCFTSVFAAPFTSAQDGDAQDTSQYRYYLLTFSNFDIPTETEDAAWKGNHTVNTNGITGPSTDQTNMGIVNESVEDNNSKTRMRYMTCSKNPTKAATATIYIDTPGEYVIWGQAFDTEKTTARTREYIAGFDGEYDEAVYSSMGDIRTVHWNVSTTPTYLDEGFHTVNIKNYSTSQTAYIGGIIVTNDPDVVYTNATTYDSVKAYGDLDKPSFGANVIAAQHNSLTSYTFTFPAATDTSGVAKYEYFIDDTKVEATESAYTAENLIPFKTHTAKCIAYDYFGNTQETSKAVEMVEWKLSDTGNSVDSTALETDNKITVALNLGHVNGANAKIFCGIYTLDEKQLADNVIADIAPRNTADFATETVILTDVPAQVKANPQNYIIKATVIDSDSTMMPQIEGITFNIVTGGQS